MFVDKLKQQQQQKQTIRYNRKKDKRRKQTLYVLYTCNGSKYHEKP